MPLNKWTLKPQALFYRDIRKNLEKRFYNIIYEIFFIKIYIKVLPLSDKSKKEVNQQI